MIFNMVGGGASGGFPEFTYTGTYQFIDDGDKNWRIKFLTSGTLVFSKLGNAANGIDVFCAGGGAGGSFLTGGGSGYTKTVKKVYPSKNTEYSIIIGAGGNGYNGSSATNGGSTSALNVTSDGGYAGTYNGKGGNGGSGGAGRGNNLSGGSDGSDGASGPGSDGNGGAASPGIGQHTTTKEFGDESGKLYASGGGTSGHYGTGSSASANTGDGGQGSGTVNSGGAPNAGNGGSGIAVIRNSR